MNYRICLSLFSIFITAVTSSGFAEAHHLPVDLTSSQINVAVRTQVLSTTAQLRKFTGSLTVDPQNLQQSKVILGTKGSDVAFGKMPIEQMFLVSGLLSAVTNDSLLFESQSLEPNGPKGNYILNGISTSGKHRDKISLPITLRPMNKNGDRFQLTANYVRTGPVGKKDSAQSAMFGDVKADGDIRLVFGRN